MINTGQVVRREHGRKNRHRLARQAPAPCSRMSAS
jgi:hypothetical protein